MAKGDSTTNDTPKKQTKKASVNRQAQRFVTGITWRTTKISTLEKFWKKETNVVFGKRGNKEPKVLEVDNLLKAYDQENDPSKKLEKLVDAYIFLKDWSQEYDGFYPDAIEKLQEKVNESFTQEFDQYLKNIKKSDKYVSEPDETIEEHASKVRTSMLETENNLNEAQDAKNVFKFLLDLLDGNKIHIVPDTKTLARHQLVMNHQDTSETNINRKEEELRKNGTRGFTDHNTGHIYMELHDQLQHDLVHEAVHLISAKFGETNISLNSNNIVNEGMTEHFTKQFLKHLPVSNAPAYPKATEFAEELAAVAGDKVMRKAYFGNEGVEPIVKEIASKKNVNELDVQSMVNNFSQKENKLIGNHNKIKRVLGKDIANKIMPIPKKEMGKTVKRAKKFGNPQKVDNEQLPFKPSFLNDLTKSQKPNFLSDITKSGESNNKKALQKPDFLNDITKSRNRNKTSESGKRKNSTSSLNI